MSNYLMDEYPLLVSNFRISWNEMNILEQMNAAAALKHQIESSLGHKQVNSPVIPPFRPRRLPIKPTNRLRVYKKTNGCCSYCGTTLNYETFEVDHVLPRARGGGDGIGNLMPSCSSCNNKKGSKNLEEYRLWCATKDATSGIVFNQKQLQFLQQVGALSLIGVSDTYQFYFEKIELKVEA